MIFILLHAAALNGPAAFCRLRSASGGVKPQAAETRSVWNDP